MVCVASVEIIFDLFNFSLVCFNISVALDKHSSVSNGNSKRWICHLFFADPACSGTLSIQSGICIYLAVQTLNSRSQRKCGGSVMHFFKNKYIYIYSEKKTAKKIPKKKYYLHWKRTEIQLVVFLFHPKKTRTDPSSSPNAERRNSAKRTSVVTFFTRETHCTMAISWCCT